MIKAIGILLIVASCSVTGISVSRGYLQRVNGIKSFINALQIIKAELVFKSTPIGDIFRILIEKCSGASRDFFSAKCNTDEGETGEPDVCKELMVKHRFKNDEIDVIKGVLSVLGRYDIGTQSETIDRGIAQLEEIKCQAESERQKNGKLSSTLGIMTGIVIAVLLL